MTAEANTINDAITNSGVTMTMKSNNQSTHKKLFFITLAAAALTLSACGKKETPVTEPAVVDGQTAVAEEATGVATANDEVAVASANGNNEVTVDSMNDDVGVATADEYEVIDGSESEEHISTY